MSTHTLILDRIEGNLAIFEYSSAEEQPNWIELPASWFEQAKEGDRYDVTLDKNILIAPREDISSNIVSEAEDRLERLKSRDTGEDVIDL